MQYFPVLSQLGGGWAPEISSVSCKVVVCEKPHPLLHGVTEGDSFNYGDSVLYSCLPGFDMKVMIIRLSFLLHTVSVQQLRSKNIHKMSSAENCFNLT